MFFEVVYLFAVVHDPLRENKASNYRSIWALHPNANTGPSESDRGNTHTRCHRLRFSDVSVTTEAFNLDGGRSASACAIT